MEKDPSYDAEAEQHFWDELHNLLSRPCETHESIDDSLRTYLGCITESKGEYVNSEYDIARCSYTLISSPLFSSHGEYVRKQIIFGLLQDDEPDVLHLAASFLLFDGKADDSTFEALSREGAFPRLISLIASREVQQDAGLHRLLMDLLYEMGRMQRIQVDDLMQVDDDFVKALFQIIEELSDDVDDPYHYPVIRLLLVLNEQFMVSAHDPETSGQPPVPLTNKVIKILSLQGSHYKTFGENIILLLNRESETSLQLLTLKLLYLLFTTPKTYEYFYTNDLRVLVDILIRNLLDLPEDASALRHTYLRVLYPLLAHTQLRYPPHYKRDEIRKLLSLLMRGSMIDEIEDDHESRVRHFEEVDQTTKRLVTRCGKVAWLRDDDAELTSSPVDDSTTISPIEKPPPPTPRKLKKRNSSKSSVDSSKLNVPSTLPDHLGMGLQSANGSSLSVFEVAAHKEKPGVITPSRKNVSKPKPEPPKARRSGLAKKKTFEEPAYHKSDSEHKPDVSEHDKTQENIHHTQGEKDQPPENANEDTSPAEIKTFREKNPPPMPKARRWRGKSVGKEAERAGGPLHHPPPPHHHHHHHPHEVPPISPPPPVPVPTPNNATTKDKSSVSAALEEAHAEAVEGVTSTLEKKHHISPQPSLSTSQQPTPNAAREGIDPATAPAIVAASSVVPPIVLAPPAPVPPRGVRGPEFRVEHVMTPVLEVDVGMAAEQQRGEERSPFEGGDSDDDGG